MISCIFKVHFPVMYFLITGIVVVFPQADHWNWCGISPTDHSNCCGVSPADHWNWCGVSTADYSNCCCGISSAKQHVGTNASHRVMGLWCVTVFSSPHHMGNHTPSSEDLSPFLGGGCHFIMAKDSPHTPLQHITFYRGLGGVLADVNVS